MLFECKEPAQAYVNRGAWVADCPAGCGSAMGLKPKETTYVCGVVDAGELKGGCGACAAVAWPSQAVWIWDALVRRPNRVTRNWAPPGHRQAIVTGHPQGQTVADLIAETYANLEAA